MADESKGKLIDIAWEITKISVNSKNSSIILLLVFSSKFLNLANKHSPSLTDSRIFPSVSFKTIVRFLAIIPTLY